MEALIYQLFFPGDPRGLTHFSFEPFQPGASLVGASGETYRGDVSEYWGLHVPRSSVLERNPETGLLELTWVARGKRRTASAAAVLAMAEFGVLGFRYPLQATNSRNPRNGVVYEDGADFVSSEGLGVWTGEGWSKNWRKGKPFPPCTLRADAEGKEIERRSGVRCSVFYVPSPRAYWNNHLLSKQGE